MADEQALTVVKSEPLPTLTVVDPQPTWWQQHPKTLQLARGTLDTLPAVGAMVGGAVATPETLGAGTVAGAALGAGVGRGARDLIAEHLGIDDPTTPLSKGARIALDTAITAAAPAVAGVAKRVLTAPSATLADFIETFAHPKDTADKVVEYLRATPPIPRPMGGPTLAAEPMKMPDGSWGYRSLVSGEPLAEGESAQIITRKGKTFPATMPAPVDIAADIRQAKVLLESGLSPSQAAVRASEGNPARFTKIMSAFMLGAGK